MQNANHRVGPVNENVKRTTASILMQVLSAKRDETIDLFAKIHRISGDEYLGLFREMYHKAPCCCRAVTKVATWDSEPDSVN